MTEGFKAYIIPDGSRDAYFEFIEKLFDAVSSSTIRDLQMDCYSDPIVKFGDITVLSEKNQLALEANMQRIGAKDVSEIYNL